LFNRSAARGGPKIPRCSAADAFNLNVQCSNGIIAVLTSSGREQYNALLVKLDKRFSNRMQFTASYAFSHLNGFYVTEDQTNWFGNPGPLDTDVHHRFSFSGVYQLPWNFQLSVIAIYASHPPFNARVGSTTDLNGDGTFGDTLPGLRIGTLGRDFGKTDLFRLVNNYNANFAGKPDGQGTTIPALTLPTKFEFGDDFWSQDIRLTKSVKLSERLQIQGFFEMFNIFNISNLTGFEGTLNATCPEFPTGCYGIASNRAGGVFGTGGPRAFQVAARLTF
jgi:hypothetical protein